MVKYNNIFTRRHTCSKDSRSLYSDSIQFATTGRTEMFAAGNLGDWHAEVPWSSVLKTPMNSHGELVAAHLTLGLSQSPA